ncbi:MAG: pilus assembly protein N-terminal domain-containing protein, partial [Pseudomonadota bacterium]
MIFLILLLSVFPAYSFDTLQSMNVIYTGDSIRIDGTDVKKVAVTNGRVIKVVKQEGRVLVINAKAKGSAYLHVWYRDKKDAVKYGFSVISASVYKKVSELKEALKG